MRIRLVVLAVVAILAGACGSETGDEAGSGSASTTEPASADADGSEADPDQGEEPADSAAPPSGDAGATFTVDGESMGGDLFSCDPSDGAGDAEPGDLELVVLSGPGQGLSIDVWHSERQGSDGAFFSQQRVEVRLNRTTDVVEEYSSLFDHDADGIWTIDSDRSVTLDGPPVTVDGDHITGQATLQQEVPVGETGTVVVAFDFEIPELSC